ncbi:MAG: hypothetical protein J0L92_10110 [Deltaproteobacteria bacterium]|nr:hypothetical protein [Deltaproteobacteria bacterium]
MRRRDALSLIGLAASCFVSTRALADAIPPDTGAADIVSIDVAGSVIVLRMGRRERRARFTQLTRVTVGGAMAAVSDLRPGMRVVVRFAASETGRESTTLVSIDVPSRR